MQLYGRMVKKTNRVFLRLATGRPAGPPAVFLLTPCPQLRDSSCTARVGRVVKVMEILLRHTPPARGEVASQLLDTTVYTASAERQTASLVGLQFTLHSARRCQTIALF